MNENYIAVVGMLEGRGYESNQRILNPYFVGGVSPTLCSRDYKEPIKVVVKVKKEKHE